MNIQPNSKTKVGVLFGGRSAEHEISILSALQAISAMDSCAYDISPFYQHHNGKFYTGEKLLQKSFYRQFSTDSVREVVLLPDPRVRGFIDRKTEKHYLVDVYFMCYHGQYGEDGCLQGLLEQKLAAYTGCSVISSAVSMNKHVCKQQVSRLGIPVLPHAHVLKKRAQSAFRMVVDDVITTPGLERFPLFVKPCHLGSSIGISVAEDVASLQRALAQACYFDDEVLVEPCIENLMEINVSVMQGRASIVEMPVRTSQVLTFEDKYLRGGSKDGNTEGMASLSRVIDPDIDPTMKQTIRSYAERAFEALGCAGVVRFDFMVDLTTGMIYFNELNPIPGSLSYYLWEKSVPKRTFTEVITAMIVEAEEKLRMKLSLQQSLEFRALG